MSKPPILAVDLSRIDTIPKLVGLLLGSIGPGITSTARAAGKRGTHDDYRGSREDSETSEYC